MLITKKNKILNNVFVFSTVTQTLGVKIPERNYRLGVRLRWRKHEIDIQFWWGTIMESIHVERRRNRINVGTGAAQRVCEHLLWIEMVKDIVK